MARTLLSILLTSYLLASSQAAPRGIEHDVDGGKQDLFDINEDAGLDLFEGDILFDEKLGRNSIIGEEYRWPRMVPYYLEDDLEINAKGVILKAFEQYRLKTCIDFKPWSGEQNYISVFKGNGCFSSIGNRRVGKQTLSIGSGCDRLATVEHEFLHALGFWHEQSRSDRDDYVYIDWDQITEGKEHNFNKYNDSVSSFLNVPYDYGSVMHYSQKAFQSGSEPTIITRIPDFKETIGQRMEMSQSDVRKLHTLYHCNKGGSSTFLDSCDFETENICGMIQVSGEESRASWQRVSSAPGGPDTDYTQTGRCAGGGYFMHFSAVEPESSSQLESRFLYPKRGFQCLQFFIYNSGDSSDRLRIWTREFDLHDSNGTLRFIQEIYAPLSDAWHIQHVSLNTSKKFRVLFEAVAGKRTLGGLSIDDLNLWEGSCPEHVWRIRGFSGVMENTSVDSAIYSPRFTSSLGYSFQVSLYPNGTGSNPDELATFLHLTSSDDGDDENDDGLVWPAQWKQMSVTMMDQNPDIRQRMSNQRSVTTDPNMKLDGSEGFFWDDPRKVGELVTGEDGSRYYRGPGAGTKVFLSRPRALSRNFIKNGDSLFLLSMDDLSHLVAPQPLPSSTVPPPQTGSTVTGSPENRTTTVSSTSGFTNATTSTTTAIPASSSSSVTSITNSTLTTIPPSSSVSSSTEPPTDPCVSLQCENDGVCVLDEANLPVCRCAAGSDWWFYGERCEFRSSTHNLIVIAVISGVCVFVVMLMASGVTTYLCVRRQKRRATLPADWLFTTNINTLKA